LRPARGRTSRRARALASRVSALYVSAMPDTTAPEQVLASARRPFRVLAETILPRCRGLSEEEWADVEGIAGRALLDRPPGMRRQLRLLVRALWWLPLLRWGRTFGGLGPERRDRFLSGVESSRFLLLRRGFWGLRTLVLMGWYGRPEGGAATGWDAKLRGWSQKGPRPEEPAPDVPPAPDPSAPRGEAAP